MICRFGYKCVRSSNFCVKHCAETKLQNCFNILYIYEWKTDKILNSFEISAAWVQKDLFIIDTIEDWSMHISPYFINRLYVDSITGIASIKNRKNGCPNIYGVPSFTTFPFTYCIFLSQQQSGCHFMKNKFYFQTYISKCLQNRRKLHRIEHLSKLKTRNVNATL